jgi:ribokinase
MKRCNESERRAYVFGNAAIDEVFLVRDLPAPGESVLGTVGHTDLGGKGANQAIALSRTGHPTTFVTAVGVDRNAFKIREAIAREAIEAVFLERPELATDRSVILAQPSGDNMIITTNDCAASISVAECVSVLRKARPGDAVLLQGNLRADVTAALCRQSNESGLFLVLNPSPFDQAFVDIVQQADALFVNETEAGGLTGQSRMDAVVALLRMGVKQVVLTLGAEGALLGSGNDVLHVPAAAVEVVDVTGAGDCFEGLAVGSALRRGTIIDETALRHAMLGAAHAIRSVGASISFPGPEEIDRIMSDTVADDRG